VLEAVGPEVVTSQDRLAKVVELLCSEMAAAFAESGTPLPPWRQHAAMMSKWQPRRSEEVDLTAAMNNGAGLLAQPLAGVGGGPPAGVRRLTGPSTVAQRLAMLGVAQQQSNPSPIAEGLEGGPSSPAEEEEEGWEALGPPSSTASSAGSSVHLGLQEAGDDHDGDPPAAVLAPAPAHALLCASHRPIPAPAPRGKSIFENIRARAAALPHRRNSTWAG
jgi:hypothetical protein